MHCDKIILIIAITGLVHVHGSRHDNLTPIQKEKLCSRRENYWSRQVISPDPMDRISEMKELGPSCMLDVGTCPNGTCSTNTRRYNFCPDDGYICPITETRTEDCATYEYVLRCECCKANGVIITVKDAADDEPIPYKSCYIDGESMGLSGPDGKLETTRKADASSIVVSAKDRTGKYLDVVKVVQIPSGYKDYIPVELLMTKKAETFELNSTKLNIISLSSNPQDQSAGSAVIEIQPDSFMRCDSRNYVCSIYNGTIKVSVTFINPDDIDDASTPGEFVSTDGKSLLTEGVVSFSVTSSDGRRLILSRPVLFKPQNPNLKLWKLDNIKGRWKLVDTVTIEGRRKRQTSVGDWVNIVFDGSWYNLGVIFSAPMCFFKLRVFRQNGEEVTAAEDSVNYQPKIRATIPNDNQVFTVTLNSTDNPSDQCYETRCLENFRGSLSVSNMSTFIYNETRRVLSTSGLIPIPLLNYSTTIQTTLNAVQYVVDATRVIIDFTSSDDGPFYPSLDKCTNSTVDMSALHFILS